MKIYLLLLSLFLCQSLYCSSSKFFYKIGLNSLEDLNTSIQTPPEEEVEEEPVDECVDSPVYCYVNLHGGNWNPIATRSKDNIHTGLLADFKQQPIEQDAALFNAQSYIDESSEFYIQYTNSIEEYFIFDLEYLLNGSCISFSADTLFLDSIFFHESDNKCKATGTDYAYLGYKKNRTHTVVRHDFVDIMLNKVGTEVKNENGYYRVRECDFVIMVR